jgi:hypothetical protein
VPHPDEYATARSALKHNRRGISPAVLCELFGLAVYQSPLL